MRSLLLLAMVAFATPAAALPAVSLDPFDGRIGFAPERPRAVNADHPLFRRILVDDVIDMPGRVGPVFTPVASAREFNQALRATFTGANMLAPSPTEAKARLRVSWREFELPFRIGISSRARAVLHYELVRIDNGQVIFARDIVTRAEARGGNAADRARGTGRAALQTNLASAALCLDKAAIGPAPADCALSPTGSFSAPIAVPAIRLAR